MGGACLVVALAGGGAAVRPAPEGAGLGRRLQRFEEMLARVPDDGNRPQTEAEAAAGGTCNAWKAGGGACGAFPDKPLSGPKACDESKQAGPGSCSDVCCGEADEESAPQEGGGTGVASDAAAGADGAGTVAAGGGAGDGQCSHVCSVVGCKTCVYVMEQIKAGVVSMLPVMCSNLFATPAFGSYECCQHMLRAVSYNSANVRQWLTEGCHMDEVYGAREWVSPCPSHVICSALTYGDDGSCSSGVRFCPLIARPDPFGGGAGDGGQPGFGTPQPDQGGNAGNDAAAPADEVAPAATPDTPQTTADATPAAAESSTPETPAGLLPVDPGRPGPF